MPSPPANTLGDDDGDTDDPCSSTEGVASPEPEPQFSLFTRLPPELRHQIWHAAVPSPGINFFNVHCFPNDHAGCNRSTSPPWCYLDLRRLAIEDDDDAVSRYDPSSWQARHAVRRSCREAWLVCAIPESKATAVTLTRPTRGLFVRAGDGRLRNAPLHPRDHLPVEPVVRRAVQVHVDDVLCLSVENCSFNLPHEEAPSLTDDDADGSATGDADEGWAYDPQLFPGLPRAIPASRICASMARCSTAPLRLATEALFSLLYSHIPDFLKLRPGESWPGESSSARLLLLFDATIQDVGERRLDELTPHPEVYWDRFGDCYVRLPWRTGDFHLPDAYYPITYRLTKVWPESNDIRKSYLESAILRSPKRPAQST